MQDVRKGKGERVAGKRKGERLEEEKIYSVTQQDFPKSYTVNTDLYSSHTTWLPIFIFIILNLQTALKTKPREAFSLIHFPKAF